ncbi:hypothetical protein BDK51DRAFT_48021 [Blyttiomyces helicus]|uniref:Uncharacterized protein n=1 Tax=Blyttiomyces helicus TaxID=388810 RepID=A0A4P9WF64_9FUNG|nr:hypothetical protein BDK51DRAFT_48021 [Blyttiomyces helicus]|eukprot:RKO91379.1 hypothetical protein BDK51DRAFT_48021 [Blyttiomyces helicus]
MVLQLTTIDLQTIVMQAPLLHLPLTPTFTPLTTPKVDPMKLGRTVENLETHLSMNLKFLNATTNFHTIDPGEAAQICYITTKSRGLPTDVSIQILIKRSQGSTAIGSVVDDARKQYPKLTKQSVQPNQRKPIEQSPIIPTDVISPSMINKSIGSTSIDSPAQGRSATIHQPHSRKRGPKPDALPLVPTVSLPKALNPPDERYGSARFSRPVGLQVAILTLLPSTTIGVGSKVMQSPPPSPYAKTDPSLPAPPGSHDHEHHQQTKHPINHHQRKQLQVTSGRPSNINLELNDSSTAAHTSPRSPARRPGTHPACSTSTW